jgi:L-lactate dehydrogenase complex protein LldE
MGSTALFVTCLVDQLYPAVGDASVRLLEQAGSTVAFPEAQTCCGQPLCNSGFRASADRLARRFVEIFEPYEEVVTPSGSCASMVRLFSTDLFRDSPSWRDRAEALGRRTFELSDFLDRRDFRPQARFEGRVAYHPSCHTLRDLGVDAAPRRLLQRVESLQLVELEEESRCCGFGGTFAVRFPELSSAILEEKLHALEASGADVVTATDMGCLMHLAGALSRRGSPVRVLHLAELLAGAH